MDKEKTLVVFCDGGARGNPGPGASAFLIFQKGKEIKRDSKFLGKVTNNVAEYYAVLIALSWILENKPEDINQIIFNLDSQLVARQLGGIYKVKEIKLKTFVTRIKEIEVTINKKIIYLYIPRNKNKIADKIVNDTIDENIL